MLALPKLGALFPQQCYCYAKAAADNNDKAAIPPHAKPPINQKAFTNEEVAPQIEKDIYFDPSSRTKSSHSSTINKGLKSSFHHFVLPPSTSKAKFISHNLPKLGTLLPRQCYCNFREAVDNSNEPATSLDAKLPANQEPISNEEVAPQSGKHISVNPLSRIELSSSSTMNKVPKSSSQFFKLQSSTSKSKFISASLPKLGTLLPAHCYCDPRANHYGEASIQPKTKPCSGQDSSSREDEAHTMGKHASKSKFISSRLSRLGTLCPGQCHYDSRADNENSKVDIPLDWRPRSDMEPLSNEEEALQMGKSISVDSSSEKKSVSSLSSSSKSISQQLRSSLSSSKPKFISHSLPNSVSSTPRVGTTKKKKWRSASHASPTSVDALERQDSEAFFFLGSWGDNLSQIDHSVSERRASLAIDDLDIISPSDDLDIISPKVSSREFNNEPTFYSQLDSQSLFPPNVNGKKNVRKKGRKSYYRKCCWYLPNLGKVKLVRARNYGDTGQEISTRVSLEKFECGSWAETAGIVNEQVNNSTDSSSYFDLPLELIRSGVRDAMSPVRSAFYFDKDASRGSRKNISTRRSHASSSSSRHVGSRSSSSSFHTLTITTSPHKQMARNELNAYLYARSS